MRTYWAYWTRRTTHCCNKRSEAEKWSWAKGSRFCHRTIFDIYHQYRFDQWEGIFILVHSSISHLAIQVAPVVQFEEACLLEIKLEGSDVMLFGCIYRSPTQTSGSDENNNNLNALVHRLSDNKRYSHVCFTGDFNFHINWHQWSTPFSSRSKEELFLETLRNSFLYQHVLEPTRRRGTNKPSTLDLVLTSEENQVSDLTYHAPLGKSDHSVLSFNFNCYLNIKLTL